MSKAIEFGDPYEPPLLEERLPGEGILGEATRPELLNAPFIIYIVENIYKQLRSHLDETPNVESGGLLVGYPFRTFDNQHIFVVVSAIIPQRSKDVSAVHFTVGPEDIDLARQKLEESSDGLIVVGWYHSHPGHGAFLSEQDMVIVRSLYNASWNIALVVDNWQEVESIFVGANAQPVGMQDSGPTGSAWVKLRGRPSSIQAIILYNRLLRALETNDLETARVYAASIEEFIQESPELEHWRVGYRDITQRLGNAERSNRQIKPVIPIFADTVPPEMHPNAPQYRRSQSRPGNSSGPEHISRRSQQSGFTSRTRPIPVRSDSREQNVWLFTSIACFSIYICIIFLIILPLHLQLTFHSALILGGSMLGMMSLFLAGNVIFGLNGKGRYKANVYSTNERLMALFIVLLILALFVVMIIFLELEAWLP